MSDDNVLSKDEKYYEVVQMAKEEINENNSYDHFKTGRLSSFKIQYENEEKVSHFQKYRKDSSSKKKEVGNSENIAEDEKRTRILSFNLL